ncbi:ABC transporter permease [Noviherbaspirillum denitrificans]|uniref:ABC transporter permease n=1 Tax=Noviherbaspirillum denitrificans TaxID=1968433 RepID=A0A254T898_9BURK|nr:ABC transporter permease [Noviherbaspirillum denitrificans]OWW18377.1 ABC transporter permease [Noviherbaspirillum denitrificans]
MNKTTIVNFAKGLLLPALLLAAWEWASRQSAVAAYVFVSLSDLWGSLQGMVASGELWLHLRASLTRTLTGLGIGATLGILTGTLMAQSRIVDRLVGPLYHAIRQVPLLGLIPLLGLWVGNGDPAKLLVIVIASFYPTVLNTSEGIRHVETRYREVGQILTLSRLQTFRRVLFPAALPSIVTGLSHALAFAWLSCMGGELLFSAGPGIGSLLLNGETAGRMDVVLLCVVVIALLAQSMNILFNRLARLLVRGQSSH